VLARGLGALGPGSRLSFDSTLTAEVVSRGPRGAARFRFRGEGPGGLLAVAERIGTVPLPPYIEAARKRTRAPGEEDRTLEDGALEDEDRVRYQTVFARAWGAVAAPTAGLHFTPALLEAIVADGHELAWVTLHVGPGTFRPVEASDPRQHRLDPEVYEVSEATAAAVRRARAEGRSVVAVGTTVVRTLESIAAQGEIRAGAGATDLYLLPGSPFRVVTDLLTNFHLPRSTLLMLVAAFAGREKVLAAYAEAITAGYRFYSYGDAMFIVGGAERQV
jgi:S-adenosylmethionine:tRNA ribosyltransferase-isomerase